MHRWKFGSGTGPARLGAEVHDNHVVHENPYLEDVRPRKEKLSDIIDSVYLKQILCVFSRRSPRGFNTHLLFRPTFIPFKRGHKHACAGGPGAGRDSFV